MTEPKTTDYDIIENGLGRFFPRKISTGKLGEGYDTLADCRKAIIDYLASLDIVMVHAVHDDGISLAEHESLHEGN